MVATSGMTVNSLLCEADDSQTCLGRRTDVCKTDIVAQPPRRRLVIAADFQSQLESICDRIVGNATLLDAVSKHVIVQGGFNENISSFLLGAGIDVSWEHELDVDPFGPNLLNTWRVMSVKILQTERCRYDDSRHEFTLPGIRETTFEFCTTARPYSGYTLIEVFDPATNLPVRMPYFNYTPCSTSAFEHFLWKICSCDEDCLPPCPPLLPFCRDLVPGPKLAFFDRSTLLNEEEAEQVLKDLKETAIRFRDEHEFDLCIFRPLDAVKRRRSRPPRFPTPTVCFSVNEIVLSDDLFEIRTETVVTQANNHVHVPPTDGQGVSHPGGGDESATYSTRSSVDKTTDTTLSSGISLSHSGSSANDHLELDVDNNNRMTVRQQRQRARGLKENEVYAFKAAMCEWSGREPHPVTAPADDLLELDVHNNVAPEHASRTLPTVMSVNPHRRRWCRPCLIKLKIPATAKVAIGREESKLRSNKAEVVGIFPVVIAWNSIFEEESEAVPDVQTTVSLDAGQEALPDTVSAKVEYKDWTSVSYDLSEPLPVVACSFVAVDNFLYEVGKLVEVPDFEPSLDKVCAPGIHFYVSQEQAMSWIGLKNILPGDIQGYDAVESFGYLSPPQHAPVSSQEDLIDLQDDNSDLAAEEEAASTPCLTDPCDNNSSSLAVPASVARRRRGKSEIVD